MKLLATLLILVGNALAWPTAAAQTAVEARDAAMREQFRAAYAAATAGAVAADDAALREYVLYPYLRAARIEQALGRAEGVWHDTDVAAAEFLQETGLTPVAQALRRAWLASLARRESWAAFLDHYDRSAATLALECQQFNARIARERDRRARGRDPRSLAHGQSIAERMRALIPMAACAARAPRRARRPARRAPARQRQRIVRPHDRRAAANGRGCTAARARRLHREPRPDARCADREPSRLVPAEVVLEAWSRLARNAPEEALASVHPRERTNDDARGRG